MDGASSKSAKGVTATVVRQFRPSRIELELLLQVFALVSDQSDELNSDSRWLTATRWIGTDEQTTDAEQRRRRAA